MGFRYLNRRRSDDLATLPWYIDGQIAVSGDYVYPNTSLPDPTVTPQLIEWGDADGSGSVQLPMIDDGASWAPSGYPFVVINTSTGSETVQVGYDDGSGFTNVGDPLSAGESGVYLWMGDEVPFHREIARIGSGGSTFVNPMANNTALQGYLADGVTPVDLAKVESSGRIVFGTSDVASDGCAIDTDSIGRLRILGSNKIVWATGLLYSVTDKDMSLGNASLRWNDIYGVRHVGAWQYQYHQVTNDSYVATNEDALILFEITDGQNRTCTLPAITADMLGRVYRVCNTTPSGSSAAVTVSGTGQSIIVGNGTVGNATSKDFTAVMQQSTPSIVYAWWAK